jgi:hypothetical protein
MKNIFYCPILIFSVFIINTAYSQTDKNVSISDLQTPVSPGLVLSDQTPSSVGRPTNPKALVASLLTLNKGGAIEFSPYWILPSKLIKAREKLTYNDYLNTKVPIFQTLSISGATFKSDTGSYISAGGRVQLFRLFSKKAKQVNDNLDAELDNLLSERPGSLDLSAIEKIRDSIATFRPVFVIELAGAWLGSSKQNSFDNIARSRTGFWLTANLKPYQGLNITLLGRYIDNKTQTMFTGDSNFLDFGGSLGYESGNNNFSLNGEYVYRDNKLTKETNHRVAVVANYRINNQIYVVGSFGKNFGNVENLISLLGINVGLNNQPIDLK